MPPANTIFLTLSPSHVRDHVWNDAGIRFVDRKDKLWSAIVRQALQDVLNIKCPQFISKILGKADTIMWKKLRSLENHTNTRFRKHVADCMGECSDSKWLTHKHLSHIACISQTLGKKQVSRLQAALRMSCRP